MMTTTTTTTTSSSSSSSSSNSNSNSNSNSSDTTKSAHPTNTAVWCPEQQIYIGGVVPGATNEDVQALLASNHGALRVFGYGSLCWKPGDPNDTALGHESVTAHSGYAKGYRRAWAQRSTDHRGNPRFPGIVCTLLTQTEVDVILNRKNNTNDETSSNSYECHTEGMIYIVPPELAQMCLEELDFREKGGYAREIITVVQHDSQNNKSVPKEVQALLYRGTPDNPAFWPRLLWDLPLAAAVMSVAVGPSGPNDIYLNQLNEFLLKEQQQQHEPNLTKDDDTCTLANMTKLLQQPHLSTYFFYGAGSNQHGQIRMLGPGNSRNVHDLEDYTTLTESVLCCRTNKDTKDRPDRPKHLYAGGGHSGLLTENGQLYLWGWNEDGQCGRDSTRSAHAEDAPLPILEPLPNIRVEKAALGFTHTLVIEHDTGKLFVFGNDSYSGTGPQQSTPRTPDCCRDDTYRVVAAGLFHSAAITLSGELVTFGSSKFGQSLQDGTAVASGRWIPPDGSKLVNVVCGRHHTAAVDEKGRIWTFGENKYGQLGRCIQQRRNENGAGSKPKEEKAPSHDHIPDLVDGILGKGYDGATKCVGLKSGWSHMIARVTDSGDLLNEQSASQIYGWGRSDKGQLATQEKCIPVPTPLGGLPSTTQTKDIYCGSESTYLIARDNEADSIYCCGWNEHRNLAVSLPPAEDDIFDWSFAIKDINKLASPPTCSKSEETEEERSFFMAAGGAHFLAILV